ncbi:MAG TPA: response regulator [Candidatus Angelobacter sp.]|nr:response regulator [Candidatus Angelobacter sp.]
MNKTRVLLVENKEILSADLEARLRRLGYDVADRVDGGEAAISAAKDSSPDVVLMDIELNGAMRGTDAAQHIQKNLKLPVIYLSANSSDTTIFRARDTEPFGFVLAPFDERELKVAIEMAIYRHRMEMEREKLIRQLREAVAQVKALSGLLPICAECKKVRDDGGYWSQVEAYIEERTEARFTHGLCPDCYQKAIDHHREEMRRKRQRKRAKTRQAASAFSFATP